MEIEIIVTVAAGILLVVAAIGTIVPVLPGSLLAVITLVVWAALIGSPVAWAAAATGALIATAGWSAGTVLTGRKLRQQQVPKGSIATAVVCAVVGMFLIPWVGLFVGFGVGLLAAEFARRKDFHAALDSTVETLKATGIGVLVEFALVCLAGLVWTIGVAAHFAIS